MLPREGEVVRAQRATEGRALLFADTNAATSVIVLSAR